MKSCIIGLLSRVVPPEWWAATALLWAVVPDRNDAVNDVLGESQC